VDQFSGAIFWIGLFAWLAFNQWSESRKSLDRAQVAFEAKKLNFEKQKMQFEAEKLLLEKFKSTEEVNAFLATEAGKLFLERMKGKPVAPVAGANPLAGIIALIVFGALGLGLALAFLMLAKFNGQPDMIAPAIVVSVPSLGLLSGAAVSYHLKKKWGLLKRAPAAPAA